MKLTICIILVSTISGLRAAPPDKGNCNASPLRQSLKAPFLAHYPPENYKGYDSEQPSVILNLKPNEIVRFPYQKIETEQGGIDSISRLSYVVYPARAMAYARVLQIEQGPPQPIVLIEFLDGHTETVPVSDIMSTEYIDQGIVNNMIARFKMKP